VSQPESWLRTGALVLALIAGHAPLFLLAGRAGAPEVRWFTGPFLLALLLAAALQAAQREATQDVGDVTARLERYAPLSLGVVLAGAVGFPSLTSWPFLWLLCFLQLPLVLCWHMARPRSLSLWVASAGALGATVLDDAAAPSLAAVALAWLLVPASETLAEERSRGAGSLRLPLAQLATSLAVVAAVGGGVFALSVSILPPSQRTFVDLRGLTDPGQEASPAPAEGLPLPVAEVFAVLGVVIGLLALSHVLAGHTTPLSPPKRELGAMQVDEPFLLEPAPRQADVAWPQGARLQVVERYLAHLRALSALGQTAAAGTTPRQRAQSAPADARRAAVELARRFGAARWSPAPVSAEAAAAAAAEAAEVEASLTGVSEP